MSFICHGLIYGCDFKQTARIFEIHKGNVIWEDLIKFLWASYLERAPLIMRMHFSFEGKLALKRKKNESVFQSEGFFFPFPSEVMH